MAKFRDIKTLQKFASVHASIQNHFNHELGARYVIEGSVRKGGDRVRVTAQLNARRTMHVCETVRAAAREILPQLSITIGHGHDLRSASPQSQRA